MIESVELVIRQPGFPDRVVALHEGATRIGRSEDNEVVLSDVGVSRRHSQVYWSGSECLIEDLGSGNGTYYRGQRVQSQPVADGDEVVLDPFVLTFRIKGAASVSPVAAPAEPGAGARLEVVVGTGMAGSSYPILSRGLSIGRAEDRDVVIPDPASSRHHCQISCQGDRYFLRDMGSANGVYVNSVRVREQPLEDGDIVRIGNTEMRFVRYAQPQTDLTTQVVPVMQQVAGQPGYTGQVVMPSTPPQPHPVPAPPPSRGSSVWLWLTGLATLAGMALLLVLVGVGAIYTFAYEPAPPGLPPRAPSWALNVPGGLEGGDTETLFTAGVNKMKKEDREGALLDFYRVLTADPASRNAKKFALAAAESVVLEELGTWVVAKAKVKKDTEASRDKLLARARRGGRIGRAAEAELEADYREDPVVIAALDWEPTPAMAARSKATKDAAAALSTEDYGAAVGLYESILATSADPDERVQALAGLKSCRRELSRDVAVVWRQAVIREALGQSSAAQAAFDVVRVSDPTNPCAALQPR